MTMAHIKIDIGDKDTRRSSEHLGSLEINGDAIKIINPDSKQDVNEVSTNYKWGGRKKTLLCIVYFAISMYTSSFASVVANDMVPDRKIHPPLPDVVFKTLPFIAEGNAVANMAVVSSVIIFIAMLAIQTKLRYVALRRFLYTVPTMYLMRVVTLCVTSLPVPVSEIQCMPKTDGTMKTWVDRSFEQFITMSISTKEGVVCGDLMFSGHTGILIYFSYFITKYTPPSCRFLHVISWCTTVIGAVSLILSRGHYTIDVVISVYLAFFTLVFHDVMIEQRLISNYRFACMAFPLMQYIECW